VNRVLITDQDLLSTPIIDYFTSSQNIDVKIMSQPDDISSIVQTVKFDLILLDLTIQDINPLSLINFIKNNNPDTTIIIIYDNKSTVSAIDVLCKGSFSPLKKPYNIYCLVSLLRESHFITPYDEKLIIDYCSLKASRFEGNSTNDVFKNGVTSSSNLQKSHFEDDPPRDILRNSETETFSDSISEKKPTTTLTAEIESVHRDKYHFIVESSPDIIFTINDLGIFTYVNSRVETLLGFNKSEMIGRHIFLLIYHEDIEDANTYFYEKNTINNNFELRFKSKKGNCEPILFDIRVFKIDNQQSATKRDEEFHDKDADIIEGRCCVARDITERQKVEERLTHDAHHDYLTGLPDKILINDRIDTAIAQSKRSSKSFALMFLDLDGFKAINDTYGHSVGDKLLQAVGARVKGCIREVDTLARVGGDEFMLLVTQIDDRSGVGRIGEKIIHEIQKPYNLAGYELTLSASIGVALYPFDGESKEELISSADMSMYHIKRNNKNGIQLSSEM